MSDPFETPTKLALKARLATQSAPRPYKFPGADDVPIAIRLLSESEMDNAKLEAQRYVVKRKVDVNIDPEFFDREVQRQIVWRAMIDPLGEGLKAPLFVSDADVRELDTVTLGNLFNAYLEHQEACSTLRQLDQATANGIAEAFRANPRGIAVELASYDHASLVKLLVSFMARWPSSTASVAAKAE